MEFMKWLKSKYPNWQKISEAEMDRMCDAWDAAWKAALQSATGQSAPLCEYDKPDGCHAGACYSNLKCNSRDEMGHPKYL